MAKFADGSRYQIWVATEVSTRLGYEGASQKICEYMVRQFKQTPEVYEQSRGAHFPITGGEVRLTRADDTYDVLSTWGTGALDNFVPVAPA